MSVDQFLLSTDTTELNYPEIRPTLDLNFARTKVLDPRITFIRNSGGSYVGADGLIRYAGVNRPRFDHDPATGESLGILIEESGTNRSFRSENLGIGYKGALGSPFIFIPDIINSPAEGSKAGMVVLKGTRSGIEVDFSTFGTGEITVSMFAKYVPNSVYSHLRLQLSPIGGVDNYGFFNLRNGTFISSGNVFNVKMERYPDNWYRCIVSANSPIVNWTSPGVRFWLSGSTLTESSINNTDGMYIWGVQVERGTFHTSYIPTIGTTRTRLSDQAIIEGRNFTNFFNVSQGTFFADYTTAFSTNTRILNFGTGSTSTIISNEGVMGSGTFFSNIGVIPGSAKVVAATSISESAGGFNGNRAVSTGACSYYANASSLNLAPVVGGSSIGQNWLKRVIYWPKRLPNEQLQALTR